LVFLILKSSAKTAIIILMLANFFDIRKKARIFLPDFKSNLVQIDERMYAKEFEGNYDEIFCYGISFFKKRCMVKGIGK